jgi:hypothetical protein
MEQRQAGAGFSNISASDRQIAEVPEVAEFAEEGLQ